MAEVETGILSRQCLNRRIPTAQPCNAKSTPGRYPETRCAEPSRGSSLGSTRITSSGEITFLNLRVDVQGSRRRVRDGQGIFVTHVEADRRGAGVLNVACNLKPTNLVQEYRPI